MSYYSDLLPEGHPLQQRQETKITFIESTLGAMRDDSMVIQSRLPKLSIEDLDKVHRQLRTLRNDVLDLAEEIAKRTG